VLALSAALVSDPLVARAPLHPPLAVQAVAPLLDQARVAAPPAATVAGVALSVTLGAAGTVTVADRDTVPPVPVHVSVYVVVAPIEVRTSLPPSGLLPLQPPEAEQLPAFAVDQVSVELPPAATEAGEAARLTVGSGMAATVTLTV
jgi:hypothetical protein